MKPGIHPDYHLVVFQDASTGTGARRVMDTAGRVEKFHRRYGRRDEDKS